MTDLATIPGLRLDVTANSRLHWATRARKVKHQRAVVALALRTVARPARASKMCAPRRGTRRPAMRSAGSRSRWRAHERRDGARRAARALACAAGGAERAAREQRQRTEGDEMTAKTAGQKRALRELCALARTALDVCDMIAARGEEHDDRPRLWLLSLERWTLGEETGPQLAARTRAMEAWAKATTGGASILGAPTGTQHAWWLSCAWLSDARADLMKNPGHEHHTPRVCRNLVDTIMRAEGQPHDAARAMVAEMLRGHRERIAGEWATVQRNASLVRAKADKVAAERALGTLPGMAQ